MGIIERAAQRLEESQARLAAPLRSNEREDSAVVERRVDAERLNVVSSQAARARANPQVDVDLVALAHKGFITPADPKSLLAEEFRVIKRPLIKNAGGKSAAPIKNGNLIMVTSALPGEGKSTTAVNLAMSIAMELDKTVLLIDADVAKPSIPGILGLAPARGLLDLLGEGALGVSDVLQVTNVPKLAILQAGRPNSKATELLASDGMADLLNEMASRYSDRVIVFDSPPLLLSNEARVLATHMGQVLIVVEAESTLQSTVSQALATIETCPVKLLMLNKSRTHVGSTYGGYGSYGEAALVNER